MTILFATSKIGGIEIESTKSLNNHLLLSEDKGGMKGWSGFSIIVIPCNISRGEPSKR